MNDPLGYEGTNVVVTGAASGMGEATADILMSLGAAVTALDINDPKVPVANAIKVDLRDRSSIDDAVNQIDGPIDSIFSCAGLPGPPRPELDTMIVNFVGARHFIESLVPKMAPEASIGCISSSGAVGWQDQLPILMQLFEHDSFDGQVQWLLDNEELWGYSGYWWSKCALDAWVGWRGADLIRRGIRLNCINPGPTDTPMMPSFHYFAGKRAVDAAMGPIGRYSTPSEQAWPLVLLNSKRMSYVSGEVLWTDGGFLGAMTTGRQAAFSDFEQLTDGASA
jgi:NAD(P)-dependent dehydrogenase (short-subunit alcohol dehydrogenase family)